MPPALISDCKIVPASIGCNQGNNFAPVGRVSYDGHFSVDLNSDYSNLLCCRNFVSNGSGAVSFKYSPYLPPNFNGSNHISVNSTLTNYPGTVKLGFPQGCFLKQTACDHNNAEVCIFKVSNSSLNPNKWKVVADGSHVADCANDTSDYPSNLCCQFNEICNDGIDNDFDGFIDCADQNCKLTATNQPPAFCSGSPYDSNKCINVTRYQNGTAITAYNPKCYGQTPNPAFEHFYCSYGRQSESINATGICCPEQKYATYNQIQGWRCEDSETCGVDPSFPCLYDFDLNNAQWKASIYSPTNNKWCQSKMPFLFSPGITPSRDTACCLIAKDASVAYFTDENNVRIFGFQPVCGDGVISSQAPYNEQCDGPITNVTCANYVASQCTGINVPTGSVTCSNNCQINHSSCRCAPPSGGQSQ